MIVEVSVANSVSGPPLANTSLTKVWLPAMYASVVLSTVFPEPAPAPLPFNPPPPLPAATATPIVQALIAAVDTAVTDAPPAVTTFVVSMKAFVTLITSLVAADTPAAAPDFPFPGMEIPIPPPQALLVELSSARRLTLEAVSPVNVTEDAFLRNASVSL